MLNKKFILLSIFILSLLTLSAVSANDNATAELKSIGTDEVISIEESQSIGQTNDIEVLKSDNGTFTDLQQKINDSAESSTLTLENDYTYNEGFSEDGITISKNLTIDGNGYTINGNGAARIFKVESGTVTFHNIVFINAHAGGDGGAINGFSQSVNCTFKENYANGNGGAIFGGNAINCSFIGNCAEYSGGAISNGNATGCNFTNNNYAGKNGGAIYCGKAEDCIFTDNHASNDDEGNGGALFNGSAVRCIFTSNSAKHHGGAIFSGDAIDCTFNENNAWVGGAVYDCNVLNCNFTSNSAASGGAIFMGNAKYSIFTSNSAEDEHGGAICGGDASYCTFTSNSAKHHGGAVFNCNATGCVFNENNAWLGGAMFGNSTQYYTINCTFTGNTAGENGGAIYNISAVNSTFTNNNAAENGGAIYNGGALNCTFTGNSANHGGAMHYEDRNLTARDCTFIGNSADGGGAVFGIDVLMCIFTNNTSTCNGGALHDASAVNCIFTGNSADRGDGAGGAIFNGSALNCTFTGNSAYHGGAMHHNDKNLTARNCTFTGNSADGGGAVLGIDAFVCIFTNNTSTCDGGALYEATAFNCTFTYNHADQSGGAVYKGSAVNSTFRFNSAYHGGAMNDGADDSCHADYCNFEGNSADGGGAVYGIDSFVCIFTNNTSTCDGGALYEATAFNCTFTYNHADQSGGAVYKGSAVNSTFRFNSAYHGGAMNDGADDSCHADNCNFEGNSAEVGGAVYGTDSFVCIFTNNTSTCDGGGIYDALAVSCTFISNSAQRDGGAIYKGSRLLCILENNSDFETALLIPSIILPNPNNFYFGDKFLVNLGYEDNLYNGFNATVSIYKNSELVDTLYTLTGNGFILNQTGGDYVFNISFDKFPEIPSLSKSLKIYVKPYIYAQNIVTFYGEEKYDIITIKDALGNPLKDIPVSIDLYGIINYTTDENGQIKIPTKNLLPDTYNASVTFKGGSYYQESSSKFQIIVYKNFVKFMANNLVTSYNSDDELVINLYDSYGEALSGLVVFVEMDGLNNYTTDYNGQINISTKGLVPKTYTVDISFKGSDIYQNSTTSIELSVYKSSTELMVTPVITSYDDADELIINFIDGSGHPIANASVFVDLNGEKMYTTDDNGQINISTEGLVPDTYIVNITYYGNSFYQKSSAESKVIINKINTVLVSTAVTKDYAFAKEYNFTITDNQGNPAGNVSVLLDINGTKNFTTDENGRIIFYIYDEENLTITLTDAKGNPLKGKNLYLDLNASENYTTDENGQVNISTKNLSPDTYLINVTFEGDEYYGNSTMTAKIIINKMATALTANTVKTYFNVKKDLVITLKDAQGNPINNTSVTVNFGTSKTYTTDKKGQITITTPKLVPETYIVKVSFAGNNYCLASSTSTIVVVKKATTKITASSKKFKTSVKVKKYTVTLKNNLNKVMKNKKVKLKIKGKIYKAKTNSKGKATFNITNLTKKGTFKATITYAGSKYYKKVTKKVKIKTV